ncbi:MAG: hypothetical protein IPJ65_26880 [Archangiaceae bacterium]|nr:hypothetical protein [Archangiaceae bacterium]
MRRSAFRLRRHPFDFAAARLRSGCSALLAAALLLLGACSPQWVAVTTTLDRVVLSVTGAAGEVLIVGGAQGNGAATLAKKFDGHAWADLPLSSPDTATLWWVARVGDSTFMVGEHGTVYRDGVKAPALTDATLFGVWGASSDEVWAVGGSPLGNGDNDVLLRFDGASWAKVPSPEPLGVAYFKVWGSARDDVWVVGQQGAAFHYDGSAWSRVTTGVRSTLLTVTGRSRSDVWAVGGPPAVLARFDGTVWKNEEAVRGFGADGNRDGARRRGGGGGAGRSALAAGSRHLGRRQRSACARRFARHLGAVAG